jgi:hypothetical protein
MPFPQHDLLAHKCLFCNLILGHVGEYFRVICILTRFFHAPMSFNTTLIIPVIHPKSDDYFFIFLENYKLIQNLEFFFWFLQVDIPMHATFIGKWCFYDGFWTPSRLFSPKRFNKWIPLVVFILFSHCTSHIPPQITCVFGIVVTLTLGSWPKQGLVKVWVKSESPGIIFLTPESVRECENMNLHTSKWAPTLGVRVPMDSWIFKEQLQGSKLIELKSSLYH